MAKLRIAGPHTGTSFGLTASDGTDTQSVSIAAFRQPARVSARPRIQRGQAEGDTLALDTGDLSGPLSYEWRRLGGAVEGNSATLDTTGLGLAGAYVECAVTGTEGTRVTPPVMVYAQMPDAAHNADDAAVLDLMPHDDATHIAVADGPWSAPTTWLDAKVPSPGARVLIPYGATVTYDNQTPNQRLDTVRIDGALHWALDRSTTLLVETLIVTRGGTLTCGTGAGRLPVAHTAEIIISNRHYRTNAAHSTDIDLASDPKLVGRGLVSMGTCIMWGADKLSWTRSTNAPMTGDTSVMLDTPAVGWQVGDRIVIGGTAAELTSQSEERIITAVNGQQVSWVDPLSFDHDHQNPRVVRSDLQPGIGNLTRNIILRSEDANVPAHQRGHTMHMHMHCHADLWQVEHRDLGRTIKATGTPAGVIEDEDFRSVVDDSEGALVVTIEPKTATSNIIGRYSAHLHFVGFKKAQRDIYHGCVVNGSPGWGMVHHGCEAFTNQNVLYNFAGAGLVAETGNEVGEWLNNLSLKSLHRDRTQIKILEQTQGLAGNFFTGGYPFAMRSRALRSNGNMAMDASWGHVFYHREFSNPEQNIAPSILLQADHLDVNDLLGIGSLGTMRLNDYPIIHFADNESAGMVGGGLYVTKSEPRQDHALNVNIKRLKSWGFQDHGAFVEYIGQYALSDFDCVPHGDSAGLRYGIEMGVNTYQVSALRATTSDCRVGIRIPASGLFVPNNAFNDTDNPRYMISAHTSNGDTTPYENENAESTLRVWATEPAVSEPTTNLPFKLADWTGATGFNQGIENAIETGFLMDRVSNSGPLPKEWDDLNMFVNSGANNSKGLGANCFFYAQQNGYWMVGGVPYIIFPMYFSDRLSGDWIKKWHGVEMKGDVSPFTNNGSYDVSTAAPVVAPASITTTAGTQAVLDVLALTTDPDGDDLSISQSYFAPDHGRFEINGGVITYQPDLGFTGSDKGQIAVEDGAGHTTRVDIAITVV